MNKCNEPGSYDGDCCCNCKFQMKLMCHPWNGEKLVNKFVGSDLIKTKSRSQFGKGSVLDQCGWICTVSNEIDKDGEATFFDKEHGMCELHIPREEKNGSSKNSL